MNRATLQEAESILTFSTVFSIHFFFFLLNPNAPCFLTRKIDRHNKNFYASYQHDKPMRTVLVYSWFSDHFFLWIKFYKWHWKCIRYWRLTAFYRLLPNVFPGGLLEVSKFPLTVMYSKYWQFDKFNLKIQKTDIR